MSRPRSGTAFLHLPVNLRATPRGGRTYYAYRRPDTQQEIGLGADERSAIECASKLNAMFGYDGTTGPMAPLSRHLHAKANKDSTLPLAVQLRLPDLFKVRAAVPVPLPKRVSRREKDLVLAWASRDESRFQGRDFIDAKGRSDDWLRALLRLTKKNAAQRGISFELTEADARAIVRRAKGACEVSGIKLRLDLAENSGTRVRRPWAPSLDRRDSAVGYTRENSRLVCSAANYAMNVWGDDVLIALAKGVARKQLGARFPEKL